MGRVEKVGKVGKVYIFDLRMGSTIWKRIDEDEDESEDEEIGFGVCCKPRDLGLGIRSGFFQLKVTTER